MIAREGTDIRRQAQRTWGVALLALVLVAVVVPAHAGAARMAYVGNLGDDTITPINTVANTAGSPFSNVGSFGPSAIAITPNGRTAYVTYANTDDVVPFDLTTNPPTPGDSVPTGGVAFAIAIAPNGQTAYVANFDGTDEIVPIDVASNTAGTPIPVGSLPDAIAITPDGSTAYAGNFGDGTVTPIDLTTNPPTPKPVVNVDTEPQGISVTPDGNSVYVANCGGNDVSVIATATNTVTTTIPIPDSPNTVAVSPDGQTAYTPNCNADTLTPITIATNMTGPTIPAGTLPYAIAFTPNSQTAYVTNDDSPGTVTPVATSSGTAGTAIPVGALPESIAITPNQAPTAAFTASSATIGGGTGFNASGSTDPDGTVASYAWDFGDGNALTTGSPTASHTYAAAGNYTATLTVTDNEGCSTAFIFTGQTASCNGSMIARISHQVSVSKASPTLTTNASADVVIGGSVHDTATLAAGQGPTGQITFKLYGPGDSTCSGAPAFTGTTTVSGNGDYQSPNFAPTQVGTYRWTASYSGDPNNTSAAGACGSVGESVNVSKASPTLATIASGGVALGDSVHDTATLAAGQSPTGQFTFNLYGPNDAACSGAPVFTDTAAVSGNGSYQSGDFTPAQAGTYRWTAAYSGDANNNSAAGACGASGESVTVSSKAATALGTTASRAVVIGGQVRDTLTLSGGNAPTGQLVVRLYRPGDDDCSGQPAFGDRIAVSGNGSYRSALFTPKGVGVFRWTAHYSGDADNQTATRSCGDRHEAVWVQKATPTLTTQASVTKGNLVGDRVTLGSGHKPTGTITLRLYGPGDNQCSSPISTSFFHPKRNGTYHPSRFVAKRPGTYRFTTRYSGDSKNRGTESACNATGESVTVPTG